jgi:hypothetical protein
MPLNTASHAHLFASANILDALYELDLNNVLLKIKNTNENR